VQEELRQRTEPCTVRRTAAREGICIREVRRFFAALVGVFPGLFYWLDTESHMFALMALLLYKPVRVGGKASVSPDDLQDFLMRYDAPRNWDQWIR
jgi:hypothetical protein